MKILFQRGMGQFIIEKDGQFLLVNIKNKTVQKHKNNPEDISSFTKLGYWYEAKPTEENKKLIEQLIKEAEQGGN